MSDTSETSAPITEAPAQEPPADDPAATIARLQSELVKARKWEDRAKANVEAAKELERLKAASMTEMERAIEETRNTTRAEVRREMSVDRVADQIRLAASGRSINVEAVIKGANLGRFVDDEGNVDVPAVKQWMDELAPVPEPAGVPRVPFGVRDSGNAKGDPAQVFANFVSDQLGR